MVELSEHVLCYVFIDIFICTFTITLLNFVFFII